MTKLKTAIVTVLMPLLFAAVPAHATDEGQIEGGQFYFVKNLTQNSAWGTSASANAGDTLVYRIRVHNFGPGDVVSVLVKATLPTGSGSVTSTATASSINANPGSVTSNATTVASAQSVSYVSGSTVLLDANGAQLQTLPNTLFDSGINIGLVKVCLAETRYVQFQVKVSTPETPVTPVVPAQPQPLAKTGAAENTAAAVVALLTVLSVAYLRSRKALAR